MKISNKDKPILLDMFLLEVASKNVVSYLTNVSKIQELNKELKTILWQFKMFSKQSENINLKFVNNFSNREIKKYIIKSERFFKTLEEEESKAKKVKAKDRSIISTILLLEVVSFNILDFFKQAVRFKKDKSSFNKIIWQYKMINTQFENMSYKLKVNKLVGYEKHDSILKSEIYNRSREVI